MICEEKKIQNQWTNLKIDPKMVLAVSEKAWTDSDLALEWIRYFERNIRETIGIYRLHLSQTSSIL
jgi:hypothetical protein